MKVANLLPLLRFLTVCLSFLLKAITAVELNKIKSWKEVFYTEEVASYLGSLSDLVAVQYELVTNDWNSGINCLDLRRKILILVHLTGNYSLTSLVHITAVRLDNELDNVGEGFHDLRCPRDRSWITTTGWNNPLQITFLPNQQKLILPPTKNGDCLMGYAQIPNLIPLPSQNHSIPRNLFVVSRDFDDHRIPIVEKLTSLVRVMNPNWKIINIPLDRINQTIKEIGGDERVLKAFNKLQPVAYKLDLYRLVQLYHQGGVWMDSKLVPLRPLDFLLPPQPKTAMMVWDVDYEGIYNAFLAFQKHNPFLTVAIEAIVKNVEGRFYGEHWLEPTGPKSLLNAWTKYLNMSHERKLQKHVPHYVDLSTILSREGIMITKIKDPLQDPLIISHNVEMRRKGFGVHRKCHYGPLWRHKAIYSEVPCQE